ncbi:MAG: hypothetical protein QXE64_00950 [Candidatus Pacearchaeota archaeon]
MTDLTSSTFLVCNVRQGKARIAPQGLDVSEIKKDPRFKKLEIKVW